ncbi:glycogen synthase [soil metagenome]
MRVLQVAWEYPPRLFGGLGRHVEGLTRALASGGVSVTVVTPAHEGPEQAPPGVQVIRAPAPAVSLPDDRWLADTLDANVAMAETTLRHLGTTIPDVLHVHDWMAGHAARILAAAMDIPVIATIHATERGRHKGHLPPGFSAWIDAQEQALVALADQVIVCAAHMADHVRWHLGADPSAVTVIHNGVDPTCWRPLTTRKRGNAPKRIIFAGRLEYEKGVQVLLAATRRLPCEVIVAGQGSMAQELQRAAHPRVRFAGHLDQPALRDLLASADIAVVPSLYEPFGLAALEAMAACVPVIASDVDGLAEVVTEGAGLRVPPDDPLALAKALRRLLRDDDLVARLVAGGSARAAELSWDASARKHRAVYATVTGH